MLFPFFLLLMMYGIHLVSNLVPLLREIEQIKKTQNPRGLDQLEARVRACGEEKERRICEIAAILCTKSNYKKGGICRWLFIFFLCTEARARTCMYLHRNHKNQKRGKGLCREQRVIHVCGSGFDSVWLFFFDFSS